MRLLYEAEGSFPAAWVQAAHEYSDHYPLEPEMEQFLLDKLWNARAELQTDLLSRRFGRFLKLAAVVLEVSQRQAETFPLKNLDTTNKPPWLSDAGAEKKASPVLFLV